MANYEHCFARRFSRSVNGEVTSFVCCSRFIPVVLRCSSCVAYVRRIIFLLLLIFTFLFLFFFFCSFFFHFYICWFSSLLLITHPHPDILLCCWWRERERKKEREREIFFFLFHSSLIRHIRHKSNHIQVAYGKDAASANHCLHVKGILPAFFV